MKLPDDMRNEIERLGEDPAKIEWVAQEESLEFARFFLQALTASADRFSLEYPRLRQFATEKRRANPLPVEASLSSLDLACRRILRPKILDAERVPQRGRFTAAIFSAPLAVLPLVIAEWPSTCQNPVFLTPEERLEWHEVCDQPGDDGPWWFALQDWDAQPNPPPNSFWLENTKLAPPRGTTAVLVTWGLCWGSMAGGHKGELWHVEENGCETRVGDLGDVTY